MNINSIGIVSHLKTALLTSDRFCHVGLYYFVTVPDNPMVSYLLWMLYTENY